MAKIVVKFVTLIGLCLFITLIGIAHWSYPLIGLRPDVDDGRKLVSSDLINAFLRHKTTHKITERVNVAVLVHMQAEKQAATSGMLEPDLLLTSCLPSFNRTMEHEFIYTVYISVQDSAINGTAIVDLLDTSVSVVVMGTSPRNTINALARRAHTDGMDYLVIISDLTEFMTSHWTSTAITTLLGHKPANVGVVGARCPSDSVNMAYSVVHRTHMDVFDELLPISQAESSVHAWLSAVYYPIYSSHASTCSVKHTAASTNSNNTLELASQNDSFKKSVFKYKALLKQHLAGDAMVSFIKNLTYTSNVPRVVWAFWFGPPMEGKRLEGWLSLKANIGAPLKLVTDEDLHLYNMSSHPMHPALSLKKGLSMNHRSDYCRVYFMHHFGGGYHDIKPQDESWGNSFDVFTDPDLWMYGIPEHNPGHIGCEESYVQDPRCDKLRAADNTTKCCGMVTKEFSNLLSNGAYIMRPNTSLTYEWLSLVENHLTQKYEELKLHPAPKPRCCVTENERKGYPFYWTEVHGDALHPLQWKYLKHVRKGLPRWAKKEYRDQNGEEDNTM